MFFAFLVSSALMVFNSVALGQVLVSVHNNTDCSMNYYFELYDGTTCSVVCSHSGTVGGSLSDDYLCQGVDPGDALMYVEAWDNDPTCQNGVKAEDYASGCGTGRSGSCQNNGCFGSGEEWSVSIISPNEFEIN